MQRKIVPLEHVANILLTHSANVMVRTQTRTNTIWLFSDSVVRNVNGQTHDDEF